MEEHPRGFLIMIGGAEDKTGGGVILRQAPQMISDEESLVILTTATERPEQAGQNYQQVFQSLGIRNIQVLNISTRDGAGEEKNCRSIRTARCVFMTGGDQLRLTSILGAPPPAES